DPKGEKRDQDGRAVLWWKVDEADLLGIEAHAPDQAAENRYLDFVAVALRCFIGDRDQYLAGGLLVMPARLDRREFRRLIIVDVIADEMSEEELHRYQYGTKAQPHSHHDTSFGMIHAPQQVPRPGCGNAEGAGQVSGEQHVRKAYPDHRIEDDLE